jgi:hypothetical protein
VEDAFAEDKEPPEGVVRPTTRRLVPWVWRILKFLQGGRVHPRAPLH